MEIGGSGFGELAGGSRAGEPRADVLDVPDGLFEQLADMVVVQVVDDAATVATADHEPEVAQHPQLVGHRRGLHAHRIRELADRARAGVQTAEDEHAARGGKGLHGLGDHRGEVRVEFGGGALVVSVGHGSQDS